MPVECDVAVIGGGPGGYVAAIRAAQLGARVVVIEKDNLGGTCTNWGCIPTKALLESARRYAEAQEAEKFGLTVGSLGFDFQRVNARKDQAVRSSRSGVETLMKGNGITVLRGTGSFVDRTRLTVKLNEGGTEDVQTRKVIIATGSTIARPPIPGLDTPGVLDSNGALMLAQLPKSIIIVGGGAIGVEFASVYSAFGSNVTIVEMMPTLLPREDVDLGRTLGQLYERRGIAVKTGVKVKQIAAAPEGYSVAIESSAGAETLTAEKVLVAVGRTPNTEGLGLERIGIAMNRRAIQVDSRLRTSVPDVYAIGDVIGGAYAHTASAEGEVAAENALGRDKEMDYRAVPSVTFSMPQVASVGLTEQAAREAGYNVKIGRFAFSVNAKAVITGHTEGFVKVVCDERYGQILGVHMIGPEVTDLIAEAVLAINLESTIEDIAATIHAHPTLPEAFREATLVAGDRPINVVRRQPVSR